jgi:hypothetical protein
MILFVLLLLLVGVPLFVFAARLVWAACLGLSYIFAGCIPMALIMVRYESWIGGVIALFAGVIGLWLLLYGLRSATESAESLAVVIPLHLTQLSIIAAGPALLGFIGPHAYLPAETLASFEADQLLILKIMLAGILGISAAVAYHRQYA